MKGDFSRFSFDPTKHYSQVLQQQGRMQLDADWNEQRAIDAARRCADGLATVGAVGAPWADPGFAIRPTAAGTGLTIGAGTLYVGGVACHTAGVMALDAQPDAPGTTLPTQPGRYLVYLCVWDRHVTALLDPGLRDPALGGPDTATRVKTLWQVLVMPASSPTGDAYGPGWAPPNGRSTGTLLAAADPAGVGTPCTIPPQAGYRSRSNQLYRIEVHVGGTVGTATAPTFKWSRDNGIVASLVTGVSGQTLTVADPGPDDMLSFAQGQLVELVRPLDELSFEPSPMLLIGSVEPDVGAVLIDPSTPLPDWAAGWMQAQGPLVLRRWDMPGGAAAKEGVPIATRALPLEYGLSVTFGEGLYIPGDYWTIPARMIPNAETGNIIWSGGPRLPDGIDRRFAGLALVDLASDGKTFSLVEDLRVRFDPLVGRVPPFRVSRGQTGALMTPGAALTTTQAAAGWCIASPTILDPDRVGPLSVQFVAEMPVTIQQVLVAAGLPTGPNPGRIAGTQPVSLACALSVTGGAITLTPDSIAIELLNEVLGGVVNEPFAELFGEADDSKWSISPVDGSASFNAATSTDTPAIALSYESPEEPISYLAVAVVPPSTWGQPNSNGIAGLVFNATSATNYWAFYRYCRLTSSGTAPTPTYGFGLAHYTGASAPSVRMEIAAQANFGGRVTLAMAFGPKGPTFAYRVPGASPVIIAFGAPPDGETIPPALASDTLVGLIVAGNAGTVFQQLGWRMQAAGLDTAVLPVTAEASIAARLVVRTALLRTAVGEPPESIEALAAAAPDWQTWFRLVPAADAFYGSTYAFFAGLDDFGKGRI